MKVKVIFSDGKESIVEKGANLGEVIKSMGIPMDFPCGGLGKCGQCKVEVGMLDGMDVKNKDVVTACTYKIEDNIWVHIPEIPGDTDTVILTSGDKTQTVVETGVKKIFVTGLKAYPSGDSYWNDLESKMRDSGIDLQPSLQALQNFSQAAWNDINQGMTIVTVDSELLDIVQGDSTASTYGLAVDIGTTTVVGYLTELNTGKELAVAAELNGQRINGADVISRISTVQKSPEKLDLLQGQVIETINHIIKKVCDQAGINSQEIYSVTLAGNTCMHHLVLGLNPGNLGRSPFKPVVQQEMAVSASELKLGLHPKARVWVFPVISGFVGGDTVAAILATDIHNKDGVRLLIDIGTNGELVLNANGRIITCSAAAGPALEGAQIAFGMRAETGAVSKVRFMPDIKAEIIGGGPAKGICGSGLIDLLAELVKYKLINNRGKFVKPENYEGPSCLAKRLVKGDKGLRFMLMTADENGGKEIYLSQEDISQLQLAKGALRAAMEMLVKEAGISGDDVDEILLAGAFGNFLDIEQAKIIGLLPRWGGGRVRSVGNAAGEGAKMALLSKKKRKEAGEIVKNVEFLEMAGTPKFQETFVKAMMF